MSSDASKQESTSTNNNPTPKKRRPILETSTVRSWVGFEYKGVIINPIIRNQCHFHPMSCSFQALAITVEILSWIAFLNKSSSYYNKRKQFSVDVASLISTYSPPRDPPELVQALIRDSNGYLPVHQTRNPRYMVFRVSDNWEEIDFEHMEDETRSQQIARVIEHVNDIGPVIGVFRCHRRYDPRANTVHLHGKPIRRRADDVAKLPSHAVCITGTGSARYEEILQPVFQYIETFHPSHTKSGDGLCYLLWDSLSYVYIPRIAELPEKKK